MLGNQELFFRWRLAAGPFFFKKSQSIKFSVSNSNKTGYEYIENSKHRFLESQVMYFVDALGQWRVEVGQSGALRVNNPRSQRRKCQIRE